MAKPLVDDELWVEIEPLLPKPKPPRFRYLGRKPLDNRRVSFGLKPSTTPRRSLDRN